MRHMFKSVLTGVALVFALSTGAYAQCSGQPPSGRICGNNQSTAAPPVFATGTSLFDQTFGNTPGSVLNRQSTWVRTSQPILGANGGTGGSVTLNGSTSGSAVIQTAAAAGSSLFQLPVGNGISGQSLITDGSGHTSWSSSGAGTVTSVGLSLPSIFTVTGSPITNTGTLAATLNTEATNSVWAGPATGSAATPTFRALVGADLPNPSLTTLGGIEAINAVTSNWIRSISTSGVPALSQPAFSDISGTLAPTQCPNPSATTIGCVESFTAPANQFINAISTSGVPSSAQPTFANISGSITLSQLPSISNNSVLGNNSGGTAIPSALSASNVLDFIGSVQGDVLFRGAAGWLVLAPGTSGQVLSTGGPSANPTWTSVTGTGTVTSLISASGIVLSPTTITTSGSIGLASIAAGAVLANITGGSATPIANTPSSILDLIGSATGDILFRGTSSWLVLAPGTSGQVLTQGASTPSWSNAGTLTNVTIAAGTGIGVSGTCNITTSGTCTITNTGVLTSGTPAASQVAIFSGSTAVTGITTGSVGQHLGVTGSTPTFKSGGWELLNSSGPQSAVTSVQDTTSFGLGYSEYEIVVEGLACGTTTASLQIQELVSGSPVTSGYLSTWLQGNGSTAASTNITTGVQLSSAGSCSATSTPGNFVKVFTFSPASSIIHMFLGEAAATAAALNQAAIISGQTPAASAMSGYQLSASTGTVTVLNMKTYGRL
jgi:hypothetical protein